MRSMQFVSFHHACSTKRLLSSQMGYRGNVKINCLSRVKMGRESMGGKIELCPHRNTSKRVVLGTLLSLGIAIFTPNSKALELFEVSENNQLPKNYVKFARKLLTALRDAIEVDLSPASENEVRRKADPAKSLVKVWVKDWRDSPSISRETSYTEISESLQLLGSFYLEKGQRARLPEKLGGDILRHLDAASAALPANA